MNIIIFGSQYGTAKQYAEVLGRRTDTEVRSYKEKTDIDGCDTIVYIGALYAGGVLGMKAFHHKTKHWYFKVFFPVLLVIQVALLAAGLYWLYR